VEEYQRNPNIKCSICAKSIYRRPAEIKKNEGRVFCSASCYGMSNRKESPCLVCKKPILASLNKKTCSRGCANIHRAGIQYKIDSPKDKVKSQQSLKVRLLEERGRKCERCNYNKYQILEVHHKNRNREDNRLEKLCLICPNCHAEERLLKKSWLNRT